MADTYIYLVGLPNGINEMVTPCADGAYTIYINSRLCDAKQREAYRHAMKHINNNDFERMDTQKIESDAHRKRKGIY